MTTHTPGPWTIFQDGSIRSASVRRPGTTVTLPGTVKGESIAVAMRNARLIAAAPALLEALKAALEASGCDGDLCAHKWHEDARKAIADAEGDD